MSIGRKDDNEKVRMDLLPSPALYEVARVLTHGAKKYEPYNWTKGMDWSRVIGALERHLAEFKYGEDIDKESGLLLISQVACNALFLLTYQIMNIGKDDRWKPSEEQKKNLKDLSYWITQTEEQVQEEVPISLCLDEEYKVEGHINIDLSSEEKQQLYQVAKEENKTINQLIVKSLKEVLETYEQKV